MSNGFIEWAWKRIRDQRRPQTGTIFLQYTQSDVGAAENSGEHGDGGRVGARAECMAQ